MKAFDIWGMAVSPDLRDADYRVILAFGKRVTLQEAIFRSPQAFKPSNLREHLHFGKMKS